MKKNAIWVIIGLMSAAVIGVVWLQMDLIRTAIRVNEERFDKNVYNALNEVIKQLEADEKRRAITMYGNGYVTQYLKNEGHRKKLISREEWNRHLPGADQIKKGDLMDQFLDQLSEVCVCDDCIENPQNPYRQLFAFYDQALPEVPLAERINANNLSMLVHQELTNRGVETEFDFGVYSRVKQSFVIFNDHYVVEESTPREILPGYRNIFNSRYRVHLFPNEMPSPGLLMIHFPARGSFVWRSLWLNFLGSILFTAIILFSFGYTINVIFRQKKLSEMKTDFINNMTHEFKTPIATISLAVDSINSPMVSEDPQRVKRFAGIIREENRRMNNQVEKVLQIALLDRNDFSLKMSEVNMHEVITNAVRNIGLQVEKRGGTVRMELNAKNPAISGDQTHIDSILNNLLDNANKYSPDEPEIVVSTRDVSNGIEVSIQDNGIGLSKEARKQIFEKFYRVHTGDRHDVKGFGLGLSYVKAMMDAHNGQVRVQSEIGKGSTFFLTFPRGRA